MCHFYYIGCYVVALFLAVGPSPACADHKSQYHYVVLAENLPIGRHDVRFIKNGDEIRIDAETSIEIKFGPITIFNFKHERHEEWRSLQLIKSVAHTIKDDKVFNVEITRRGAGYRRVVNSREDQFNDSVRVLALWHKDLLTHRVFMSPIEDKLYRLSIEFVDEEQIEIGGQPYQALHYQMTGDSERDIWYDSTGHILQVRLHDYSLTIDYVLDEGGIGSALASKNQATHDPERSEGR